MDIWREHVQRVQATSEEQRKNLLQDKIERDEYSKNHSKSSTNPQGMDQEFQNLFTALQQRFKTITESITALGRRVGERGAATREVRESFATLEHGLAEASQRVRQKIGELSQVKEIKASDELELAQDRIDSAICKLKKESNNNNPAVISQKLRF